MLPSTTTIGLVSNTELSYLDGVTSAIQGQFTLKAPLASPTFTGTVVLPSTTSIGTVSNTEIGYLDGVSSAIQTQLAARLEIANDLSDLSDAITARTNLGIVLQTNILYVDAALGDDLTAVIGDPNRPYSTLEAARDDAYEDHLIIVYPNDNPYEITSSLSKYKVNWYFHKGVIVQNIDDYSSVGIWDESGGSNGSYSVLGHGDFRRVTVEPSTSFSLINIVSGNVYIEGDFFYAEGSNAATCYLIHKTGLGPLILKSNNLQTANSNTYLCNWIGGDVSITADEIYCSDYAIYEDITTFSAQLETFRLTTNSFIAENSILTTNGTYTNSAVYITANFLKTLTSIPLISCQDACSVYITTQQLTGQLVTGAAFAGKLFVNTLHHRASASNGSLGVFVSHYGGLLSYTAKYLSFDSYTGYSIDIGGGEAIVSDVNLTAPASCFGLRVLGGTLRLNDSVINTTAESTTSPITKTAGTLVVKNCVLVAEATTDSISAPVAQTVVSYGSYANKAVDADVTIDGLLTVGAYVV